MARTTTTAQRAALEALDRATHVVVEIEDPDGNMQDIGDLQDEDFLQRLSIEASADWPISRCSLNLWRAVGEKSLAPLMEGSPLNVDAGGSYAPRLNPTRAINVKAATMLPGEVPSPGDYVLVWEGQVDDIDWGPAIINVECRDPMARLNDTFIEGITTYGGGSPPEPIEDVMQQILDDNFGSGAFPLTVVGDPDFGITGEDGDGYQLGNVTVLEALKELADQNGWSLHWRWDASAGEFRLTFYEPVRDAQSLSGFTAAWSFTPDRYYDISRVAIGVDGIRNAGRVVYTDADGARQEVDDERSSSIAVYERRFISIDTRGSSIQTSDQATNLLASILDDLEYPKVLHTCEAPLHWPIELGDVHEFPGNDVHYDTTQTFAVFAYRHEITPSRIRTIIESSGRPSGGFRRWLGKEAADARNRASPVIEELTYAFNSSAELVVSARTNGGALRVAAGSSRPTDATVDSATLQATDADGVAEVNLGSGFPSEVVVAARAFEVADGSGSRSSVKVSKVFKVEHLEAATGNFTGSLTAATGTFTGILEANGMRYGPLYAVGPSFSLSNSTSEATIETVTVPAGALGDDGVLRVTIVATFQNDLAATKTLRVRLDGDLLGSYVVGDDDVTSRIDVLFFESSSTNPSANFSVVDGLGASSSFSEITTGIDTSAAVDLTITAQVSSAAGLDGIILRQVIVELIAGSEP